MPTGPVGHPPLSGRSAPCSPGVPGRVEAAGLPGLQGAEATAGLQRAQRVQGVGAEGGPWAGASSLSDGQQPRAHLSYDHGASSGARRRAPRTQLPRGWRGLPSRPPGRGGPEDTAQGRKVQGRNGRQHGRGLGPGPTGVDSLAWALPAQRTQGSQPRAHEWACGTMASPDSHPGLLGRGQTQAW